LNINISKIFDRIKNNLNPKNIWERIKEMPKMDHVYWSKVIIGFITGIIFGATNFTAWPAVLTMLLIFLAISGAWALYLRNKELGIKLRSYFTSAIFQYFLTTIAIWTIIWAASGYLPFYDW